MYETDRLWVGVHPGYAEKSQIPRAGDILASH